MDIVLKFKDGVMSVTTLDGSLFGGTENFFELIHRGKENNETIKVITKDGEEIVRRYNDLHSIEIII